MGISCLCFVRTKEFFEWGRSGIGENITIRKEEGRRSEKKNVAYN